MVGLSVPIGPMNENSSGQFGTVCVAQCQLPQMPTTWPSSRRRIRSTIRTGPGLRAVSSVSSQSIA